MLVSDHNKANDQQGVDFDRDLAKLNTIRDTLKDMRKHGLRGGLPQDEAFFLLGFIDSLWGAYTTEGSKADRLRDGTVSHEKWLAERIDWLKREMDNGGNWQYLQLKREETMYCLEKLRAHVPALQENEK
jgi:hypothetical protein